MCSPVAIGWNDIVDAQLLANLFDAQMQCVGVELFTGHIAHDSSWQVHEASSLVVRGISPAVALLSLLGSVGVELCSRVLSMQARPVVLKVYVTNLERGCDLS